MDASELFPYAEQLRLSPDLETAVVSLLTSAIVTAVQRDMVASPAGTDHQASSCNAANDSALSPHRPEAA